MSEIELKPCPFCGGEAETYECETSNDIYDIDTLGYVDTEYYMVYGVGCCNCGCVIAEMKTEEKAIEAWNTRKPMERIVEQLEELKKFGGLKQLVYNQAVCDSIEIVKKGGTE
jgi:hypothetical protein